MAKRTQRPLVIISKTLPIAEDDAGWAELNRIARVMIHSKMSRGPLGRNPRLSEAAGLIPLVSDKVDSALFDRANRLRVVSNYAVGYNNIDLGAAARRGVAVCNTPDVLTNATAELTIALLFAGARRFKEGTEMIRRNAYKGWDPRLLLGRELAGARLGLVGFGRIGQSVAVKARALGMDVIVYSRVARQNSFPDVSFVGFAELLRTSDFISLHCPLSVETRGLLGPAQFKQMKPGAFLVNTARGEIVDEAAMLAALNKGILRGAALDVFCNEPKIKGTLRTHPGVFILPHVGSATLEARQGMARLAIHGVVEILNGRVPENVVQCLPGSLPARA